MGQHGKHMVNREMENTILVSFDIKVSDVTRNSVGLEACQASPDAFCLTLINLRSKGTIMVFYLSCISRVEDFAAQKESTKWKTYADFI